MRIFALMFCNLSFDNASANMAGNNRYNSATLSLNFVRRLRLWKHDNGIRKNTIKDKKKTPRDRDAKKTLRLNSLIVKSLSI